jgi:hypothetical protein
MTNPYLANNHHYSILGNGNTAHKQEVFIGKTDTMNLPETYHFIDIDTASPLFSFGNISITNETFLGLSLSTIAVLVSGLCLLKYGHKTRDYLFNKTRLKISESTILFHDLALNNLEILAELAHQSDQDVFNQPDFLYFVKFKYSELNNWQDYQELVKPIQQLERAFKAQFYYQQIENIESNYKSDTFNNFSRLVSYFLAECPEKDTFQLLIQQQLLESLNSSIDDREKQALLNYFQEIHNLIEEDCGFTILRLFKQCKSEHFPILSPGADNIEKTGNSSPDKDHDNCQKLAQILALPKELITDTNLQLFKEYIRLERRYSLAFNQFTELINILHNWYVYYQVALDIRHQYPLSQYRQPQSFKLPIPGRDLYHKYQQFIDKDY